MKNPRAFALGFYGYLKLAPVHLADEGESLHPVAVQAELNGVVEALVVGHRGSRVGVVEQLVVVCGLLEHARHHRLLLVLRLGEALLEERDVDAHRVSLLVEELDALVDAVGVRLLVEHQEGGQYLIALVSHRLPLKHGGLAFVEALRRVVDDAVGRADYLVEHVLCARLYRDEAERQEEQYIFSHRYMYRFYIII